MKITLEFKETEKGMQMGITMEGCATATDLEKAYAQTNLNLIRDAAPMVGKLLGASQHIETCPN